MARLIVAPIGEQPGAVLAPLLSKPLRPSDDDTVLLLDSGQTERLKQGQRIAGKLGDLVTSPPEIRVVTTNAWHLDKASEGLVREAANGREAWLLVNGGTWPLNLRLVQVLKPRVLVASRDHRLWVFTDGQALRPLPEVHTVGMDNLLELLGRRGARYSPRDRVLRCGNLTLPGVLGLAERSGFLFAAVDPRLWDSARRRSAREARRRSAREIVDAYRRYVLDHERLRDLGLEQRRIFLRHHCCLADRCEEDGTPMDRPEHGLEAWLEEWKQGVASADLFHLPERTPPIQILTPERGLRQNDGDWDGPALVSVVGPQPGTTLQGVWARRPASLCLIYDAEQPWSCYHAALLAAHPELGCGRIVCCPISELGTLEPGEPVLLDPNPGDKLSKLRLELWRCGDTSSRQWDLDAGQLRPSPARPAVPLQTWLSFHARGGIEMRTFTSTDEQRRAAKALLSAVANLPAQERGHLPNLRKRRRAPRVSVGNGLLILPDAGPIHLDILGEMGTALADGGRWLEWGLGCSLFEAGVDEIVLNYRTYAGRDQRAEVDAVTRCGLTYVYWSCKPRWNRDHFEEARGQTDRLVGRQRPAVLVVPHLPTAWTKGGRRKRDWEGQGWPHPRCRPVPGRAGKVIGFVIDAGFLTDSCSLYALASDKPPYAVGLRGGHRGEVVSE